MIYSKWETVDSVPKQKKKERFSARARSSSSCTCQISLSLSRFSFSSQRLSQRPFCHCTMHFISHINSSSIIYCISVGEHVDVVVCMCMGICVCRYKRFSSLLHFSPQTLNWQIYFFVFGHEIGYKKLGNFHFI